MTEDEARRVLKAYRFSRPRLIEAVTTLVQADVLQARVAVLAGLTPAAVSRILHRHAPTLNAKSRVPLKDGATHDH